MALSFQNCGRFDSVGHIVSESSTSTGPVLSSTPINIINPTPAPPPVNTPVLGTPQPTPVTEPTATISPSPTPQAPGPSTDPNSLADNCLTGDPSAPGNGSAVTPRQLRRYSGVNKLSVCGEGQIVAVVISPQSSDVRGDLAKFSAYYGLPAPTADNFKVIMPAGQCFQGGTSVESHIDVQMVHAMAPKATILLACPGDGSVAARAAAITAAIANGATIVSMSWGAPEVQADMNVLEPVFAAHPSVTFFAGSGDYGSNSDANGNPRTAYPASSQYVVAVGATAETGASVLATWNLSGGGISKLTQRPAWQSGLNFPGTGRLLPDIAFNGSSATPTSIYGVQGWNGAIGTSVASPIAAGMMALANQLHHGPIGDIHAALYSINTQNKLSTYFRDVTIGNNGLYNALNGFDLVSGLGSPKADMLIPWLLQ